MGNQVSVPEIRAAVGGGPDSPAMGDLVRKLKATKRPPQGLDNATVREALVRGFKRFLADPMAEIAEIAGATIGAGELAAMARTVVRGVAKMEAERANV